MLIFSDFLRLPFFKSALHDCLQSAPLRRGVIASQNGPGAGGMCLRVWPLNEVSVAELRHENYVTPGM